MNRLIFAYFAGAYRTLQVYGSMRFGYDFSVSRGDIQDELGGVVDILDFGAALASVGYVEAT